jgi:hypothetical protein
VYQIFLIFKGAKLKKTIFFDMRVWIIAQTWLGSGINTGVNGFFVLDIIMNLPDIMFIEIFIFLC